MLFIVLLNVVMLSVIMPNVVMLSVIILCVVAPENLTNYRKLEGLIQPPLATGENE
jgi:hypothetical protein